MLKRLCAFVNCVCELWLTCGTVLYQTFQVTPVSNRARAPNTSGPILDVKTAKVAKNTKTFIFRFYDPNNSSCCILVVKKPEKIMGKYNSSSLPSLSPYFHLLLLSNLLGPITRCYGAPMFWIQHEIFRYCLPIREDINSK